MTLKKDHRPSNAHITYPNLNQSKTTLIPRKQLVAAMKKVTYSKKQPMKKNTQDAQHDKVKPTPKNQLTETTVSYEKP